MTFFDSGQKIECHQTIKYFCTKFEESDTKLIIRNEKFYNNHMPIIRYTFQCRKCNRSITL